MRVIDFHSHFFSRPFFEALAAQAPGNVPADECLAGLAARTGIEVPPHGAVAHADRWIEDLDAHGVEHLCTFASVPEEVPAVAEAVAHAAGRFSGFALVNPHAPGCATKVGELLADRAFRGVLLFPAMHHFHVAGEEAQAMLRVLDEHGAIAYVHCGLLVVKLRDLLGLPRPYDLSFANPLGLIPAANRFRRIRFVIPHFGAGFLREALMAGTQCENVYVDTSSSNSWVATQPGLDGLADVFRRALSVYGAERVLFGTDSNVHPAGWRRDRLDEQRAVTEALGLSEADQALIFAGNAARLLALPRP